MTDLPNLTIDTVRNQVALRQITATGLVDNFYRFIDAADREVRGYLALCRDRALQKAQQIDTLADRGEPLPKLAGVPMAIKDEIVTEGVATTCGSRILEQYIPPYDATAVQRLEAEGAVILGKTNCDEFAMGSSTENSAYGPVRNPCDLTRVPGGSSGGSAAVVASGTAVAALGSDTGGSIRQPASFCGVVGLLPTYGRVSRYGLVAFASSLDHIGPIARSAKDAATVLGVIAGHDPLDSTSASVPVPDYVAQLDEPIRTLRIGVPREAFGAGLDKHVEAAVRSAIQTLAGAGCEIVDISLPHSDYAIATYYIIATAEASANLARFDGVRYGLRVAHTGSLSEMYRRTRDLGFGPEVKRRILLGTYVLSAGYYDAYYRKAQQVRTLLARDFQDAFKKVDVIVTPTAPTPAFRLGEKTDNPLEMYLADIYTVTADLAGIPGLSVPCGAADGLPIGVQLLGRYFEEGTLLRLAHHYERLRASAAAAESKG
jgi:aspartyl-tRNA(Asn)/glutamyl-tRNA(Gln) amidotransferase subunit A